MDRDVAPGTGAGGSLGPLALRQVVLQRPAVIGDHQVTSLRVSL